MLLFHENRSGIKKNMIFFYDLFCRNTDAKFRESDHSNHVIPHLAKVFSLSRCILLQE